MPSGKQIRRALRFILTGLRSARILCRQGQCWQKVLAGMRFQFRIYTGKAQRVRPELWAARLRACYRCPIFDPKRQTCGNGQYGDNPDTEQEILLGCQCVMPLAALMPAKNCWIYDTHGPMTNGLGWPIELNGSECQTNS